MVVVTGASSGVGRETALTLARAGAHPILLARRRDALEEVAERCRRDGAHPVVAPADVADGEAVQQVADTALQRRGRLDGWVNAASVMEFGTVLDVPPEDVRRVLDVNLMGAVHGCRAALPPMIAEGRGAVVNVSSILGVIALPFGAGYTMTKFGLRGLGVSLRQELRLNGVTGVGVSTVLPAAWTPRSGPRRATAPPARRTHRLRWPIPATSRRRCWNAEDCHEPAGAARHGT